MNHDTKDTNRLPVLATLVLFALYLFPLVHNVNINGTISSISIQGVYQELAEGRVYSISFIALKIVTAPVAVLPLLIISLQKTQAANSLVLQRNTGYHRL